MCHHINVGHKLYRWIKRASKWGLIGVLTYVVILLVGLVPVNSDFEPTKGGVQIFLVSNLVHADIIVPVSTAEIDWADKFLESDFHDDISNRSHIAFGWGDRGFFLETKTWDDFKVSTAAKALLIPSNSCVHVTFTRPEYYQEVSSVNISREQYARLVEFIDTSFQKDDRGKFIQILDEAYSTNDAFFCSSGRYHLFNTCNSWAGRCLQSAGVKTPWLSPLPKTPMLYFENR